MAALLPLIKKRARETSLGLLSYCAPEHAPWIMRERIAPEGILCACAAKDKVCLEAAKVYATELTERLLVSLQNDFWGLRGAAAIDGRGRDRVAEADGAAEGEGGRRGRDEKDGSRDWGDSETLSRAQKRARLFCAFDYL